MGIRQFGGHVEFEIVREIDIFLSHLNSQLTTLFNFFVLKHGLENRVNILTNIFQ
jgi:hypothetical protein